MDDQSQREEIPAQKVVRRLLGMGHFVDEGLLLATEPQQRRKKKRPSSRWGYGQVMKRMIKWIRAGSAHRNDCESTWLNPEGEEVMMSWQRWLRSKKRDDEKQERDAKHERLVQKMKDSAGGGACFLHKMTKPAPWKGGCQVLENLEDDAKPAEGEITRQERARHWQCEEEVRKSWKNEELKKQQVDLPRLKEERLQKVARSYQDATGVGCDGFHPKVLLFLEKS